MWIILLWGENVKIWQTWYRNQGIWLKQAPISTNWLINIFRSLWIHPQMSKKWPKKISRYLWSIAFFLFTLVAFFTGHSTTILPVIQYFSQITWKVVKAHLFKVIFHFICLIDLIWDLLTRIYIYNTKIYALT